MSAAKDVEILLVEDNPHDAELVLRALERSDLAHKAFVVRDGVEALEFFTGRKRGSLCSLKVVLLDLKLPKVDGLEVLRQLKSEERTRAIPIVVLTSSREEQDIAESYKLGANSFIVKPVNFETFTKAVCDIGLYWLRLNEPVR